MAKAKTKPEADPKESPRVKQGSLPEMEPPSIPEIEEAADGYVKARNAWQRKHQPMMEAQEILHDAMRKHKQKRYDFDGKIVEIVGSEKVKVKSAKEEEGDED